METNLDMLYIIIALHGKTAIILGFCNPMISIIFKHKRLVAVAINAKQCATFRNYASHLTNSW